MPNERSSGNAQPVPAKSADALAGMAQLNMGRVLRPLVMLATAISAYLHAREFFSPDFILRYNPDEAYVALLLAYSGHRELRRWNNDPQVIGQTARRGEYFIVGWWTAYFITVLIADHTARYRVPDGLFSLCFQILGIFFGTLASQHFYKGKERSLDRDRRDQDEPAAPKRLEDRILVYLQKAGAPVSSANLEDAMDVSRSTIQRATGRLLESHQIRWTGRSDFDPAGGFELTQKMNKRDEA